MFLNRLRSALAINRALLLCGSLSAVVFVWASPSRAFQVGPFDFALFARRRITIGDATVVRGDIGVNAYRTWGDHASVAHLRASLSFHPKNSGLTIIGWNLDCRSYGSARG